MTPKVPATLSTIPEAVEPSPALTVSFINIASLISVAHAQTS